MKPLMRLLLPAIAGVALAAKLFSAASAGTVSATQSSRHELAVLKTYAVKDGPYVFRAYLVEWKGQEVIVDDRLVRASARTDETFTVLVMKSPYPRGAAPHGLLKFMAVPRRKAGGAASGPQEVAPPASQQPPVRHALTVKKVYSADDENHLFRAYVVDWQGEEVIVSDALVKTRHEVGDAVNVLVMQHPHPDPGASHGLLHFEAMPAPPARTSTRR